MQKLLKSQSSIRPYKKIINKLRKTRRKMSLYRLKSPIERMKRSLRKRWLSKCLFKLLSLSRFSNSQGNLSRFRKKQSKSNNLRFNLRKMSLTKSRQK